MPSRTMESLLNSSDRTIPDRGILAKLFYAVYWLQAASGLGRVARYGPEGERERVG